MLGVSRVAICFVSNVEMNHQRTSVAVAGMSASYAEAVVSRLKTDIGLLRSDFGGRADVGLKGRHFRS